jgi:hypothetical protein
MVRVWGCKGPINKLKVACWKNVLVRLSATIMLAFLNEATNKGQGDSIKTTVPLKSW